MTGFRVRGWCPDAWRPMASGDGLLVRVKPQFGRLTRDQMLGLFEAATLYGNGLIDLTSRANLQLRGVSEAGWPALLERLIGIGLVDADPVREQRRNVLLAPDWQAGDDTHRIATDLLARLDEFPALPGKMGFVIDAGPAPLLGDAPGDFRIERGAGSGLILRADGRAGGAPLVPGAEATALVRLAHWFVESGGTAAGRMARHTASPPPWATEIDIPMPPACPVAAGPCATGVAFGQLDAAAMAMLVAVPLEAVRITPWRMLLIEGAQVALSSDPLHAVDACVGAPACPQASIETRDLARRLAPRIAGRLHVSGCAKGCARARAADVVVTGREGLLDLAFDARADAPPVHAGLTSAALLSLFGTD